MQVKGLSAQKIVHSCTDYWAYGDWGIEYRSQISGVGGQGVESRRLEGKKMRR
jgi:hypothetical protein